MINESFHQLCENFHLKEMLSSFSRKGRLFNHINKPSKKKKKNECILWS